VILLLISMVFIVFLLRRSKAFFGAEAAQ
jgi:hypothetical protein